MLKLKKLQILGFKSFCDRTELKFHGDGIAAIVGPNGCGKSNIADAIAWVLGEQSAKTLRGSRMEDVIFAGTRERKPNGMAEVSLTLIDPELYDGGDANAETEIEIKDELPADDWDEAAVRADAAAATERVSQELQPGQLDEEEGEAGPENEAPTTEAAPGAPPVVLKIRRRKFETKQFKAGQIVITRRLFRSGDSEYLMNGKLCRLRDIQDIFMGTGLGPESYAIIEQGRIGQILSSKPYDRRAIIEEAAGITKFKTKKRLAEARLEEAKLNLARVNDIFEEVTRQMNSLKRQASKAERYAKLRDEMRERLRVVLASKFEQMARDGKALEAELAAVGEDMQAKGALVSAKETEHTDRTQRGYAIENEMRENAARVNQIALETNTASARQRHNEERCAELTARSAAGKAELERVNAQHETLATELETNRAIVANAAADVSAAKSDATLQQEEAARATTAVAQLEQQQEQRREEILSTIAAAAAVRNEIATSQEHLAALERESQRIHRELGAANSELASNSARQMGLAAEHETATHRVRDIGAQIDDVRAQLECKRAAEVEGKRHLDGLRAEFATALGKRASLEAVIAEHGYTTESVKRLFQANAVGNKRAPVGVLADFLEVEPKYEAVVEDFLRDELNYVVVKSWDAADEGLRLLRSDVDGRATFLVHPNDAQAKFSFAVEEGSYRPAQHGPIVPVKNCIRVLNGFGKSLEVILPKLREGYLTPDGDTAKELALENPAAFFLSPGGECFHNVTVTGGKQRSEGPLSMKRELRDVARQVEELERAVKEQERQLAELAQQISALTGRLDELEATRREAEKAALTSGHALEQLDGELSRTNTRVATFLQELDRVMADRRQEEAAAEAKQASVALHEQKRSAMELAMTTAQEELARLKAARDTAAHTASERMARLAGLEERRIAAAAALQRIETMAAEIASRRNELDAQIAGAAAEQQQRQAENLRLTEQLAALANEKVSVEQRGVELKNESEQVRAALVAIEQELRELRAALDQARDRKGELAATAAKLQSDLEHMRETCLNELNIPADELIRLGLALVAGEQLAAEEAVYREMRTRLDNMGPVNMMALEEYKETAARHTFLETQRKDLLESIENTQNTIKEIDEFSRAKFKEAFERINENFQLTFRKLFGGGQAFMKLTDEENAIESGIDVVASPPGKRLQNVLLLSGGEKALTALALLVGIFQYQPSPFCLLDEVDAPLDEANIGRFTELVKEMAVQTQFVIITHSKKTMGVAPVMYGVTMQEPGVSKIVSVKFGEPAVRSAQA